jgi:hypothetical protein
MFRALIEGAAWLGVIAIIFVALLVAAGVAAVRTVRRTSRRLRGHALTQLRPVSSRWGRRLLDLRALADPNPALRRIAALRNRLADEIEATERMLTHTGDGRVFTADARALLSELRDSAASVDADLQSVAAYRDLTLQQRALTLLTEQAEQLIAVSYSARQTVLETSVHDRWRSIATVTAEVDHQAAALARYRSAGSELDLDAGSLAPFGWAPDQGR